MLQEEHDSFHDLADRMLEDKDKEISRLLYDNNKLQRALDSELKVCSVDLTSLPSVFAWFQILSSWFIYSFSREVMMILVAEVCNVLYLWDDKCLL